MTECQKCGSCCKVFRVELSAPPSRLERQYFKARSIKVKGKAIIIPARCPHLTTENLCDIHGIASQPLLCKRYGKHTIGYYIPPECVFNKKKVVMTQSNGRIVYDK